MAVMLHKLDVTKPCKENGVQPTVCRTRSKDPLVFYQRKEAQVLENAIPGAYRVCGRCWPKR